jgi:signal transduction histidine kinase
MVRIDADMRSPAAAGARVWALVPALLITFIFLLDLSQPADVIFSMLYVVPIVLTLAVGRARATYMAFLVSSVATVAAAAFGAAPLDPGVAFTNRALTLVAQVLAAAVVIQQLDLRVRMAARAPASRSMVAHKPSAGFLLDARSLIASLPEPLVVIDAVGLVVEANPAMLSLLGLERTQIEGCHWSTVASLVTPRSPTGEPIALPAAGMAWPAAGCDRLDLEVVVHAAGQTDPVHCALIVAPVRDTAGMPRGAVVLARDITDDRARDAEKDASIAMAAHELRAPLSTMRGYTQLAQANALALGIPTISATLDKTIRQVDRLNRLIGDLLDTSRIQPGHLTLRYTVFDMVAFVREVVEQHQMVTPSRTIEVIAAELPSLRADERRLQQAVVNLLDNALKYSPDDSPVRIVLDCDGDRLLVSVHDQGIGIPEAEQERIFQRFYRAPVAMHRASGLGVGLSITNQIIEAHGGRMWVRSTEGEGSEIGFSLPLSPESPQ